MKKHKDNIEIAQEILTKTLYLFVYGTGNSNEDINRGLTVGINVHFIINAIRKMTLLTKPEDLYQYLDNKYNEEEKRRLIRNNFTIIYSNLFKIGNCFEMAISAVDIASIHNVNAFSYKFSTEDHGFVILDINGCKICIDPWFKDEDNTGAIIEYDPEAFFAYHKDLLALLRDAKVTQQVVGSRPLSSEASGEYLLYLTMLLLSSIILYTYNSSASYLMFGATVIEPTYKGPLMLFSIRNSGRKEYNYKMHKIISEHTNGAYSIGNHISETPLCSSKELTWMKNNFPTIALEEQSKYGKQIQSMLSKLPPQEPKPPKIYRKHRS